MGGSRGLSTIGLGVGISLDELVVGFTIGFTNLPAASVITAILIQAFLAIMLGQFLGRKAPMESNFPRHPMPSAPTSPETHHFGAVDSRAKVTNFPVSSGMGAALQQIVNDLGPAWLGSTSVRSAVKQAGNDDDYALKTGN
jgi:hypothetical protein